MNGSPGRLQGFGERKALANPGLLAKPGLGLADVSGWGSAFCARRPARRACQPGNPRLYLAPLASAPKHARPRPSSSGPGRRPFTAKTGVRFPLGAPIKSMRWTAGAHPCPSFGQYIGLKRRGFPRSFAGWRPRRQGAPHRGACPSGRAAPSFRRRAERRRLTVKRAAAVVPRLALARKFRRASCRASSTLSTRKTPPAASHGRRGPKPSGSRPKTGRTSATPCGPPISTKRSRRPTPGPQTSKPPARRARAGGGGPNQMKTAPVESRTAKLVNRRATAGRTDDGRRAGFPRAWPGRSCQDATGTDMGCRD